MKKNVIGFLALMIMSSLVFVSCEKLTSVTGAGETELTAAKGESIIILRRNKYWVGFMQKLNVYVDDQIVASIGNGEETSFTVKNGKHKIVAQEGVKGARKEELDIEVNSQIMTIAVGYGGANVLNWKYHLLKGDVVNIKK